MGPGCDAHQESVGTGAGIHRADDGLVAVPGTAQGRGHRHAGPGRGIARAVLREAHAQPVAGGGMEPARDGGLPHVLPPAGRKPADGRARGCRSMGGRPDERRTLPGADGRPV
ncbi:hypothetical protein G6F58_013266 [Rhizopus delemar]|nr:hypothetical protein G6F58_013266 [Rhizopus delemar]